MIEVKPARPSATDKDDTAALIAVADRLPRFSHVFGTGSDLDLLRRRARAACPNVRFQGFVSDIPRRLAEADLLVHLCPEEPFGLVVLEAMAAGLPVLVADGAGTALLVKEGINGFRFPVNNASALAGRLVELKQCPPERLNSVRRAGLRSLSKRFSARKRLADYRKLLQENL